MLGEIKKVHGDMLAAIEALDRLTAADEPDEAALAQARYRLGRASGRRRLLVEAACSTLTGMVSPAEAERLKALLATFPALLADSSRHITIWSLREVMNDWNGYRAASVRMRQSLRDQMVAEQRLLYPLLERM